MVASKSPTYIWWKCPFLYWTLLLVSLLSTFIQLKKKSHWFSVSCWDTFTLQNGHTTILVMFTQNHTGFVASNSIISCSISISCLHLGCWAGHPSYLCKVAYLHVFNRESSCVGLLILGWTRETNLGTGTARTLGDILSYKEKSYGFKEHNL